MFLNEEFIFGFSFFLGDYSASDIFGVIIDILGLI